MTVKRYTSDDKMRIVAEVLEGQALYDMVSDCIVKQDLTMLKTIKDAKRFYFDLDEICSMDQPRKARMSTDVLPMIDALAVIFDDQFTTSNTYSKHPTDPSDLQRVTWNCFRVTGKVMDAMANILYDTVDQFVNIAQNVPDYAESNFKRIRKATLALIASIACANNDERLVRRCIEADPDVMTAMLPAAILPESKSDFHIDAVCPQFYALFFGSEKVLDALDSKYFAFALAQATPNSASFNADALKADALPQPQKLDELLRYLSTWRIPDVAPSVLRHLLDEEGRVAPQYVFFVQEHLIPELVKGENLHLLDLTLEKFPSIFEFGIQESEAAAKYLCHPKLLSQHLSSMEFPRPQYPDLEHHTIFEKDHPVAQILQGAIGRSGKYAYKNPPFDPDACLSLVIGEMDKRGILDDLLNCVPHDDEQMFSHLVAHNGWQKTISILIGKGMDFTVADAKGLTPMDEAQVGNHSECVELIRCANSAKEAMKVLSEIESEFGLCPPLR